MVYYPEFIIAEDISNKTLTITTHVRIQYMLNWYDVKVMNIQIAEPQEMFSGTFSKRFIVESIRKFNLEAYKVEKFYILDPSQKDSAGEFIHKLSPLQISERERLTTNWINHKKWKTEEDFQRGKEAKRYLGGSTPFINVSPEEIKALQKAWMDASTNVNYLTAIPIELHGTGGETNGSRELFYNPKETLSKNENIKKETDTE